MCFKFFFIFTYRIICLKWFLCALNYCLLYKSYFETSLLPKDIFIHFRCQNLSPKHHKSAEPFFRSQSQLLWVKLYLAQSDKETASCNIFRRSFVSSLWKLSQSVIVFMARNIYLSTIVWIKDERAAALIGVSLTANISCERLSLPEY